MRCWLLAAILSCADVPPNANAPANCRSVEHAELRSVRTVEPLYVTQASKGGPSNRLVGATVVLEPEPGTSTELVQHRWDCSAEAPLGVPGARALVTSGAGSYRVAITSDDDDSAREILRRARALPR